MEICRRECRDVEALFFSHPVALVRISNVGFLPKITSHRLCWPAPIEFVPAQASLNPPSPALLLNSPFFLVFSFWGIVLSCRYVRYPITQS